MDVKCEFKRCMLMTLFQDWEQDCSHGGGDLVTQMRQTQSSTSPIKHIHISKVRLVILNVLSPHIE